MMTVDDCMRAAWRALLRGNTAERDRMCALATNLTNARERLDRGYPSTEVVVAGEAICLRGSGG